MSLFSAQNFRTEFVRQSQATIIRKVTMTQFLFVIAFVVMGMAVLNFPWWSMIVGAALGYVAGYTHNGELVIKRLIAIGYVWLRSTIGRPRIVNIQAEWDELAKATQVSRARSGPQAVVTVETESGSFVL